MTAQSNVSLIARGVYETRHGEEITAGGVVKIAEGIFESWRSPIRWSYGSGDDEVSGVACLADMYLGRRDPKGQKDSKFLPAMYRAIADVFNIDGGMTDGDKVKFKRAWQIAAAKVAGVPVEFVDTDTVIAGKRVKLRAVEVPAAVAFGALYDEKGLPTAAGKVLEGDVKRQLKRARKPVEAAAVREAAESTPIECIGGRIDGIKVPSVTEISKLLVAPVVEAGLMPPPPTRNGSARSAKFEEALEYVANCLDLFASGKDESEFAPCDALESKMRSVAERIAAYFAA